MQAQRRRADADHLCVVAAEDGDDLLGEQHGAAAEHKQDHRGYLHAEPEGLAHTGILARAVGKAAYRLEALAKADDRGIDEHDEARDDRHRGDRRVAVHAGSGIEQNRGYAGDALAAQGREADVENPAIHLERGLEVARINRDRVWLRVAHEQQNGEAHKLRERRSNRRARCAHAKAEDEQRIEQHIQDAAGGDADHAVHRQALKAQQIIHHKRAHHERRRIEDVRCVVLGVGRDGFRRAEEAHQRVDIGKAQNRQHNTHAECREEADGGIAARTFLVARAQRLRHVRACAHAHHEGHGLDDRHRREDDADRAGGGSADLTDEERIRHIIDGGDEHGDDRGDRQARNDAADGRFKHHLCALFGGHAFHHRESTLFVRIRSGHTRSGK